MPDRYDPHQRPPRRGRALRRLPLVVLALTTIVATAASASSSAAVASAPRASAESSVTVPTPGVTVKPGTTTATIEWTLSGDVRWLSDVRIIVRDGDVVLADLTRELGTWGYGAPGSTEVDHLLSGHTYQVSVTAASDGIVGATATRDFTTLAYEVEEIGAASITAGKGASVPFAVRLEQPPRTDVDVTVTVDPAWLFTTPEVTVRVPAGALSATGSVRLAVDDVDEPTLARFSLPEEPDRYFKLFRVFPAASGPLPQLTLKLPSSVTESDATQSVPVTAVLDRPFDRPFMVEWSSSVDDGYGVLFGNVTFPAGATTAQFGVRLPGDDVANPGRYLRLIMGSFYNTDPADDLTVPQLPYVPIVDDEPVVTPSAHALSVDQHSMFTTVLLTGRTTRTTLTWRNDGTAAASDVHLTGRVSQPGAVLRVTAAGRPCPTARVANGVTYDCSLGTLDPGQTGQAVVDVSPVAAAPTVRMTATIVDGDGARAVAEPLTFSVEGPTCTVVGDAVGGDTLTGTKGADVLCGPAREFGRPDLTVRPGAGNDVILAVGNIDYTDSPKPLKVVSKPNALRITGWGNDILQDIGYHGVPRTLTASRFADTLVLRDRLSVDAGAGDDTITDPEEVRLQFGEGVHVDGGPGVDTLVMATGYPAVQLDLRHASGVTGVENVTTGDLGDTIKGDSEANRISTGKGDDTVDVSDGIAGNDTVDAGAGVDTCVADEGDTVTNCEKVTWVPVP